MTGSSTQAPTLCSDQASSFTLHVTTTATVQHSACDTNTRLLVKALPAFSKLYSITLEELTELLDWADISDIVKYIKFQKITIGRLYSPKV